MRSPLQKASVKRTIATITATIDPHLEAGFQYFSTPVKTSYGLSGGEIFRFVDGQLKREDEIGKALRSQLKVGSRIFDVVKKFPEHTKVKFQFEKGEPAKVKAYSVPMLLQDIADTIRDLLRNRAGNKAICLLSFFENGELELEVEGRVYTAAGEEQNSFFEIQGDAKCLYRALNRKTQRVRFVFEQNVLHTQADVAFPEFEITAFQDEEVIDEGSINNIKTAFAYLESGAEEKIRAAMAHVKNMPGLAELVKDRYLGVLKARSNDPSIPIEALPTFLLNKVEVKLLMERVIHAKHLNLAYLNRHESKLVVDFIGSIINECIDIEEFKRKAVHTESKSGLEQLLAVNAERVRTHLQRKIDQWPESWMGRLCQKLLDLKLEKVFFEKTLFSEANKSLVLEGFYLFLGLSSSQPVYIDIHQSEAPEIPEIIWMLGEVPRLHWSQTPANMPASPLRYSR